MLHSGVEVVVVVAALSGTMKGSPPTDHRVNTFIDIPSPHLYFVTPLEISDTQNPSPRTRPDDQAQFVLC
jgi:hypothetical protein